MIKSISVLTFGFLLIAVLTIGILSNESQLSSTVPVLLILLVFYVLSIAIIIYRLHVDKWKLQSMVNDSLPYTEKAILSDLLQTDDPEQDVLKRWNKYNFRLYRNWVVILVKLESFRNIQPEQLKRIEHLVSTVQADWLKDPEEDSKLWIVEQFEENLVVVFASKSEGYAASNDLAIIVASKQTKLEHLLNVCTTVTIGAVAGDAGALRQSYLTAKAAMAQRYTFGKGKLIIYDFDPNRKRARLFNDEEKMLIQAVKNIDLAFVERFKQALLDEFAFCLLREPKELQLGLMNLAFGVVREALKGQEDNAEYAELLLRHIYDGFSDQSDFVENLDCISGLCSMIVEDRTKRLDEKNKELIRMIEHYVAEHGMGNIMIEHIAEHMNMSSAHIGKIFKSGTGKTLLEYITDRKVAYARELLLQSQKTVSEISELVGYSNIKSFSRVFKQHSGLTPKEFRIKHSQ